MRICVYTICKDEAYFAPFFARHYATFADRIVVYDEHSTDGTRAILRRCPQVELRDWRAKGLDDEAFRSASNEIWKEARGEFDWVAFVDFDELLWHPNITSLLDDRKAQQVDLLNAQGWNMVPDAPPVDDGHSQFYELTRLGVPVENYSKSLVWNPNIEVTFDYGRHYVTAFSGRRLPPEVRDLKLLHCHFLGVDYTLGRNARNYDRARNKKFAWNYDEAHNHDPNQPGSVAWVKRVIREGLREDVFSR